MRILGHIACLVGIVGFGLFANGSEELALGRNIDEVRRLNAGLQVLRESAEAELIRYATKIEGADCTLMYLFRDGSSVSLLYEVDVTQMEFGQATAVFARLFDKVRDAKSIDNVSVKLNGIHVVGSNYWTEEFSNVLVVNGKWKEGYVYSLVLKYAPQQETRGLIQEPSLTLEISRSAEPFH